MLLVAGRHSWIPLAFGETCLIPHALITDIREPTLGALDNKEEVDVETLSLAMMKVGVKGRSQGLA